MKIGFKEKLIDGDGDLRDKRRIIGIIPWRSGIVGKEEVDMALIAIRMAAFM